MASAATALRLFIGGTWRDGKTTADIRSPFDQHHVSTVHLADTAALEEALVAADQAFSVFRRTSRFIRSRLLAEMARRIEQQRSALVEAMIAEAGKPRMLSDIEVSRAVQTFTVASEEARRLGGEVVPMDWDAGGRAFAPAISMWVPRGPVLGISPFNFPLNLVAHKVAPALAVGAPILIKPAPQAPGASAILAKIFEDSARAVSDSSEQVPLSAFQWLQASNEVIARAVQDPRVSVLSFTGSDRVGWLLQQQATRKRVLLELGGNAAVIVHSDADLGRAAARCAYGAFAYAGQICISVQRVFVQEAVLPRFRELLLAETAKIGAGSPADASTLVGPIIDSGQADRVMAWIEDAKRAGARVLIGGNRSGNIVDATVLENVAPDQKLVCEEAFGPVLTLSSYREFHEAIAQANASRFGLQAGVFTENSKLIRLASEELEVGGILVNEIPTYRADHMPYGGVKDSGLGREGLRFAMEEFCERRTVVQWRS